MRRILVTGMSGKGKSSALESLRLLGFRTVDTDVVLSAPANVLLTRIATRTTNPYGETAVQRELVLRHLADVEPRLRRTCTHEIDAAQPLVDVVAELAELGRDPGT